MSCQTKLIFVYNTRLNAKSLLDDFLHEILPNKEANCKLCDLTYSYAWKKREWLSFLNKLSIGYEFCFIEEFEKKYAFQKQVGYPCVFLHQSSMKDLIVLLPSSEINTLKTVEQLIEKIQNRLEQENKTL